MKHTATAAALIILASFALAPLASAGGGDPAECDDGGPACIGESTYGDPYCGEGYYGEARTFARADAGAASADVTGYRECYSFWGFYENGHGIRASASTDHGGAAARWSESEWGYDDRGKLPSDGEFGGESSWERGIYADAYTGAGYVYAGWEAGSYGGWGKSDGEGWGEEWCDTYVGGYLGSWFWENFGCPLGTPPSPPDLDWGNLLL